MLVCPWFSVFHHVLPALSSSACFVQEVAKHNTRESAWIIIKDKVYDITGE